MNSSPIDDEPAEDRFDAAAAWHVKWKSAPASGLSGEDLQRWKEWRADPANQEAYGAVEFVSQTQGALQLPALPSDEQLAADDRDDLNLPEPPPPGRMRPAHLLRGRQWALLASAAAIAAVAIVWTPNLFHSPADPPKSVYLFDTAYNEKRRYTLPDGSEITLGNQTHLSVNYGKCHRTILLESGEALFKVAHNPACPFVVIAGNGQVTAIGTEFAVNRTLDRVTVRVAEGVVDVRPRAESVSVQDVKLPVASTSTGTSTAPAAGSSHKSWASTTLARGQEVSFEGTRARSSVESEDPAVARAWIEGRREYRREPLSYVVADINRYFGKKIILDNAAGHLQFTGRVYETQVPDWLHALETIFPVTVSQDDADHISIRARLPSR